MNWMIGCLEIRIIQRKIRILAMRKTNTLMIDVYLIKVSEPLYSSPLMV